MNWLKHVQRASLAVVAQLRNVRQAESLLHEMHAPQETTIAFESCAITVPP